MKKYLKFYVICWAIALAVFNVIAFVVATSTAGIMALSASFWIAYAFITIIFFANLVCSILFFKERNKNKTFLKLSIIFYAYCSLIVSLIVGALAMAIPVIPYWIGIIVDVLLLAFYAVAITKAVAAGEIIADVEQKVKAQTSFIKLLTADAETLVSTAKTDETKALAKKVYEAIRYSDPMSTPELNEIEASVQDKFSSFSHAVKNDDIETSQKAADELTDLLKERNSKCKVMK